MFDGKTIHKSHEGLERYNKALALDAEGKTEEAITAYREAVGMCPDLAEAHYNLGLDLALAGKNGEAIRSWRRAIWLNSDYQHHLMKAFDIEFETREAEIFIHAEIQTREN